MDKGNNSISDKPNYFILFLIAAGLIFCLYLIFHKDKNTTTPNETSYKTELPRTIEKKYLFSSVQEFKNIFNSFSKTYNLGLKINKLNVEQGDVNNTFIYMLTKRVGLVGAIDKSNNSLVGISMTGKGDGSLKSGVEIVACMTCIIGAVDQTLSPTERKNIMEKLGFFNDNVDLYNLSNQIIINGTKYFINSNHEFGLICGADIP